MYKLCLLVLCYIGAICIGSVIVYRCNKYATTMCGYIGGFCRHGRQLRERPSVLLQANASAIVEGRVLLSMPIFGQHGCVEI